MELRFDRSLRGGFFEYRFGQPQVRLVGAVSGPVFERHSEQLRKVWLSILSIPSSVAHMLSIAFVSLLFISLLLTSI